MSGAGPIKQGPKPQVGEALQRPVLSPDGNFVAVISAGFEIHIISLARVCPGSRVTKRIILPKTAQTFLPKCHLLKWSPEIMLPASSEDNASNRNSECACGTTWLVLSDGDRVIAIRTELYHSWPVESDRSSPPREESSILADFEMGQQYGKITLVDFVFSHHHVLLLFETCTHASILSLTKFQRDDVLLPKFSDARSFCQPPQRRHFALLTRSNGQDQVSVFSRSDDGSVTAQTFKTSTVDAQGIQWCPDGDPLLAVWDSASYGLKIVFVTALGHHLRHLDITSPDLGHELAFSRSAALGVLKSEWLCRQSKTILVVAGPAHVLIYEQKSKASAPMLLASYEHHGTINSSAYTVWQESSTSERSFSRLHTTLEALPHDTVSAIDKVAVNADCTMFAVKGSSRPSTVEILSVASATTQTVLNLREHVKQISWHPALPNVLLVLGNQNPPTMYVWHDPTTAPAIAIVPMWASSRGHGRIEGYWLPNELDGRHLLMLTSQEAFDIGFLEGRGDGVFFESILHRDFLTLQPPGSVNDADLSPTPSCPKPMVDVAGTLSTNKGDPIHAYARRMKW